MTRGNLSLALGPLSPNFPREICENKIRGASRDGPSLALGIRHERSFVMLRAALAFFILAIVAYVLGASGIAGISMEIGQLLLGVFLVLAIIGAVVGLVQGRRGGKLL